MVVLAGWVFLHYSSGGMGNRIDVGKACMFKRSGAMYNNSSSSSQDWGLSFLTRQLGWINIPIEDIFYIQWLKNGGS